VIGIAFGVLGAAAVAVIAAAQSGEPRQGPAMAAPATPMSPGAVQVPPGTVQVSDRWLQVLERLGALRDHAWRVGDPGELDRVYAHDSPALLADRRMLHAYWSRGLRPGEVRLDFAVVRVVDRRPGQVTLAVVDRLRPTRIHTDVGEAASLPADHPTAHTIVLRRVDGRWLIADVAMDARP
jgi:hypothetical protein